MTERPARLRRTTGLMAAITLAAAPAAGGKTAQDGLAQARKLSRT